MVPGFAAACCGELSVPQAASEGSVKADASKAVITLRMTPRARRFLCFSYERSQWFDARSSHPPIVRKLIHAIVARLEASMSQFRAAPTLRIRASMCVLIVKPHFLLASFVSSGCRRERPAASRPGAVSSEVHRRRGRRMSLRLLRLVSHQRFRGD
jgi:hypothetical protein